MITADLALIQAKRGIENAINDQNQQEQEDIEDDVIPDIISEEAVVDEPITPLVVSTSAALTPTTRSQNKNITNLTRKKRIKKIKKIRKK